MQHVFCSLCINICPSASSPSCIAILGGETTSVTLPHPIFLHWAPTMLLTQDISSVLHCCGKIPDITQGREGLCSYSPSWLQEHETVRQQEEMNDTPRLAYSFSFGSGSQPIGAAARAKGGSSHLNEHNLKSPSQTCPGVSSRCLQVVCICHYTQSHRKSASFDAYDLRLSILTDMNFRVTIYPEGTTDYVSCYPSLS